MVTRREPRVAPIARVVLDTNVLLSALVFTRSPLGRLRSAWQSGSFVPLTSTTTARELVRVLAYPKFKLDTTARQELLADYLPWAKTVTMPNPPPAVPACRDPDDLPFLYLAVAGRAKLLVSGDADLLALAEEVRLALKFQIVSPAAFLESLGLAAAP